MNLDRDAVTTPSWDVVKNLSWDAVTKLNRDTVMNRRGFLNCALGAAALGFGLFSFGSLTGCRESEARTEIIAGALNTYEVDYSLVSSQWDNPLESSIMSWEESESDSETTYEQNDPEYSEDPTTEDEDTAQSEYDDSATTGRNATSGGEDQSEEEEEGEEGTGGSSEDSESTQQGYQQDDDSEEQDGDGEIDSDSQEEDAESGYVTGSQSDGEGAGGTLGQTYNDGTYEDLPSVSKIAAVGPYATIVQALGGPGTLAACNADWYNSLPSTAFSNGAELADTVKIADWGDGTRAASAEVLQQIIDSGAQAVLTSDSYPCIASDEEAAVLHAAGIDVVVMPVIGVSDALDAGIETCVSAIGVMLKDVEAASDGKTPADRASDWRDLHDRAINNTVSANGGYTMHELCGSDWVWDFLYQGEFQKGTPTTQTSTNRKFTLYFDEWATAKYELASATSVGSKRNEWSLYYYPWYLDGVRTDFSLGDDGTLYADIRDGTGCAKPFSGLLGDDNVFRLYNYYFQCAGVDDRDWETANGQNSRLNWNHSPSYFNAPSGYYTNHAQIGYCNNSLIWSDTHTLNSLTTKVSVGDDAYPALIVRDESMAQHIAASRTRTTLSQNIVGLFDYGKSYACYVMPRGLDGSWTDATFESFLMVPWLYCMFWQMEKNDNDVRIALTDCDSYVNEFYEEFYRCGASGILDAGLDGVTSVSTNGGARGYGGYASVVAV